MAKTFITAEIGINAGKDLNLAKDMVNIAIYAGADAVKFQTWSEGRFPDLEHLRMDRNNQDELFNYCERKNIRWFSTPFDIGSINFLRTYNMEYWKVPSGLITDENYLVKIKNIVSNNDTVIMSTGMSNHFEIGSAYNTLRSNNKKEYKLIVCHCITQYPTPLSDINLNILSQWDETYFGGVFGFSDHSLSTIIPAVAVGMGATYIEKHFTLDRMMKGPDHKASLMPTEFKEMVNNIRTTEQALGNCQKKPTEAEMKVRDEIRGRMK